MTQQGAKGTPLRRMMFESLMPAEGSSYVDPFFAESRKNIQEASIVYGAYHFFSFDSPASTQAENFLRTVGLWNGMLPPVVDVELYGAHKSVHPNAEIVREELTVLLQALEEQCVAKPVLYVTQQSYALFIEGYFAEYPLWIRDVYFTPRLPQGRVWDFWQYTDKEKLAGYDGPEAYIDMNVFRGTEEELKAMIV